MLPRGDTAKRRILQIAPGLIGVALLLSGVMLEYPFVLGLFPYESVGAWKTTDVDGNECVVEILSKNLSNTIPPGELPRIKLTCSSGSSSFSLVHDTKWRFGLG